MSRTEAPADVEVIERARKHVAATQSGVGRVGLASAIAIGVFCIVAGCYSAFQAPPKARLGPLRPDGAQNWTPEAVAAQKLHDALQLGPLHDTAFLCGRSRTRHGHGNHGPQRTRSAFTSTLG